jgi:hypothetical protein
MDAGRTIYDIGPDGRRSTSAWDMEQQLIADTGFVEPWPSSPAGTRYHNHYLVTDGYKYWGMGPQGDRDPPEAISVINRAGHPDGIQARTVS